MDQALIESIAASLKELEARGGQAALMDERRVRGKLADSHADEVAARKLVIEALKSGLPARLAGTDPALVASALNRESDKLRRQLGADSAIARGAVTAWALTLGLPVDGQAEQMPEAGQAEHMIRCEQGHVFARALMQCPVCGWEAPKAGQSRAAPWLQSLVFSDRLKPAANLSKPMPLAAIGVAVAVVFGIVIYLFIPSPHRNDLVSLANRGDPAAQNALGLKYAGGLDGTPLDESKAVEWYKKAANQGFAKAETNLGDMYFYGRGGLSKDLAQAGSWYQKAAQQDFPDAQYRLGFMYENGVGVNKDVRHAVSLYRSAADGGYADAENVVGVLFATGGEGLPRDENQAVIWYEKAADQGAAKAQMNLGDMYFFGRGVDKDYQQAISWYTKAAGQHLADAQLRLGYMNEKGLGVEASDQNALDFYQKAARSGSVDAQNAVDRLTAKISGNK